MDVTGLRAADHEVDTEAGPVAYDVLVIATGAHPVTLPGSEGVPGVHLLRTLDDAVRLGPVLERRHAVVVVGAGWIGAEFTTAALGAGCAVTVVEAADLPLAGTLPAEVAAPMAGWYGANGAELLTHARVDTVEPGRVRLADGRELPAGAVVVGIGARPATGWLAGSGIALDPSGAVTADDRLRTSLPDVYAVGDCASFPPPATASASSSTTGTTPSRARARSPPRSRAPTPARTTPCRTSGPSSSGASCSTRDTTRARTSCCGAATRRTRPGPCSGCAPGCRWPSSPSAAPATRPRAGS